MIYQLADNGTMACILPHGVLFRDAAEGNIREYLVKDLNYPNAVIGLPPNPFYGTPIPTCILVIRKCHIHPDNILFIDASANFEKGSNQNVLPNDYVDKIVNVYCERTSVYKYSKVVLLNEISENDYNLNIPRYVDTFEQEEAINLIKVSQKLREIETRLEACGRKFEKLPHMLLNIKILHYFIVGFFYRCINVVFFMEIQPYIR